MTLAIDPTGKYVHNGSNVLDVEGDTVTVVHEGSGGNSTTPVDLDGTSGLVATYSTHLIEAYDLSDPIAPMLLAYESMGPDLARELGFAHVVVPVRGE